MILRRLFCFILALFFLFMYTESPGLAISVSELNERIISESAVLIDGDTGQVLYDKDMHKIMRPASITKVMTALLALENGDLDATVTMTSSAWRGIEPTAARISLIASEEITLRDAIYALSVVSAADTSNAIAEHISGSVSNFVKLMNDRAKELGALNTNFRNTHGMPDNNHLTTAYDMALISAAAVNTPGFNEIFSAHEYRIPPTNVRRTQRILKNQNRMITGEYVYDGLLSGKTGWTISSQHTLFTAAERDGRTLVCIVIKSPNVDDKYEDTTLLFDYGFSEFNKITFSARELENASLSNADGRLMVEDFAVHEDFTCLIPRQFTRDDVSIEYVAEIIESDKDDEDSNEDDDDDENGNAGNKDAGDAGGIDKEVEVRIVFTLNASSSWQGVTELGEVTGSARLIEQVIEDDIADPDEEPPESEPEPEPPELTPVPEPSPDIKLEQEEPPLSANKQTSNSTYIENHISATPGWLIILRDAAVIIIPLVIILCLLLGKKRRNK